VLSRLTVPLNEAEKKAAEKVRPLIAEESARRQAAEAIALEAQKRADVADDVKRERAIKDAAALRLMAEAIVVPALPRLLAEDVTPEALASLMFDHGGRIGVLSDEGGVFSMMGGRYSRNGDAPLEIYLKGHSGGMPYRVDRKGRGAEYIEAPALTLGLAVQPDVVLGLADIPGARGRGLLARFLWSLPTSLMGARAINAPTVPFVVDKAYRDNVGLLVTLLADWPHPAVLMLRDVAHERFVAFETALEPRLGP
jgi:replicative DNA helicase